MSDVDPHRPVALVTGGAIRVGRAIVLALGAAGYRVWVHHHGSTDAAQELRAKHADTGSGGVLELARADLTQADARRELCSKILDPSGPAGGRLDLLVNNAASFEDGPFLERTDADLERVLALNLVAPVSLCRHLAPALARAPGGSIVNILDVAAFHPWRRYLDHCTAKAGLWMATRALAVELAPIRVNAVSPGTVLWPEGPRFGPDSEHRAQVLRRIPLLRIGRPEDVADAVLFFARSSHVTGQNLAVDGGRLAAVDA